MTFPRLKAYFDYYVGRAQFLFIHIPKNAGVAMRKSPLLGGRLIGAEPHFHKSRAYTKRLLETMKAHDEHHGYHHARLIDIAPRVRRRLQSVAIIRNPWSRVVSRFRFAQLAMKKGASPADYAAATFEEFLEERHVYGEKEFYWHRAIRGWYPQADYVTDEQGAIAVDLLRQEHLGDDFKCYFGRSEAPRHRNVSGAASKDYRDYYTKETIQIVADWYAKDIDTFGFDFDTPATRNVCFATPQSNRRTEAA